MSYYYPPINEKHLKILIELSKQHSDYFTALDCPYSSDTKGLGNTTSNLSGNLQDNVGDLEDSTVLLFETQKLYKELQSMGADMDVNTTSAERNTYFKLSVTLLEKLLNMQERIVNVAGLTRLQSLMLDIMADEIPVDIRNSIMERLKKSLEPQ